MRFRRLQSSPTKLVLHSPTARDPCSRFRASTLPQQTSDRSKPLSQSISLQTSFCLFRLQPAPSRLYQTPSARRPERLHQCFPVLKLLTTKTRRGKVAATPNRSRSSSYRHSAVHRESLTVAREWNTAPEEERRTG